MPDGPVRRVFCRKLPFSASVRRPGVEPLNIPFTKAAVARRPGDFSLWAPAMILKAVAADSCVFRSPMTPMGGPAPGKKIAPVRGLFLLVVVMVSMFDNNDPLGAAMPPIAIVIPITVQFDTQTAVVVAVHLDPVTIVMFATDAHADFLGACNCRGCNRETCDGRESIRHFLHNGLLHSLAGGKRASGTRRSNKNSGII
jgi:hypothetical protein